ncbi:MAG: fibrillarin-like rRNA/tRNA 2'-O-methyltransferase [Candidatus Saliniplasma sp.]
MKGPVPVSDGTYRIECRYFTLNLVPGEPVYGEDLLKIDDFEYRHWDPNRSKLGAFLVKEGGLPFSHEDEILYLGAGDGTTVSHVSDILTDGRIFAVEKARKPYRNLLKLSRKRKNIFPIMADANHLETYEDIVEQVDFVYQDIAQRNQLEIFLKNLTFIGEGGYGMIAIKSRSIDVSKPSKKVIDDLVGKVVDEGYEKVTCVDISRWQKGHSILIVE